jgi:hypothetical protein
MIPVDQTRVGWGPGKGNCLAACLASIFEVELTSIDNVSLSTEGVWWNALQSVCNTHGYQPFSYSPGGPHFPQIAPGGFHIACSSSHATVALDGVVVHDPHPRRSGVTITEWILLIPLAPVAHG